VNQGCAGCARGGRGVVERKSCRDALRIDEGERVVVARVAREKESIRSEGGSKV